MPTNTLTAAQLKGAGIFNGFVIPASGGSSFTNVYSMEFDGNNDYFDVGNPASLQITGALTLSAWVKIASSGGSSQQCIISKHNGSTQRSFSFWAYTTGSTTPIAYIYSGASVYNVQATTNIRDGFWHHVMLVYTPNTSLNIYIDGVLEGSNTTSIPASINNATQNFEIGRFGSGTFQVLGNIDEVAVWNSDQNANIATIYNSGAPNDLSGLSPLSWWRMGDGDTWNGSQWILTDNGSGGNDATSVLMDEADRVPISPNSYSQNSFVFDGIGDYFNVANNTTIGRTQNISFSVWMKSNTTARQWIIGNTASSNTGTGLFIENTDILIFQIGDGTNDSYFNSRVSSFSTYAPTGQWNHILATFDGADVKIFINGVLRNTWSPTTPYTISGWSTFYIGRRFANLLNPYNGYLDEVAIWDNDQSANISTIFNNGVPQDISSFSPISWWRMGDAATWNGSVWTLTDQGSGGNDATSVSMPFEAKTGDQPYVL